MTLSDWLAHREADLSKHPYVSNKEMGRALAIIRAQRDLLTAYRLGDHAKASKALAAFDAAIGETP